MQIHTVDVGDTIFNIARKYSTSPMKIIENNELENPDRLSVGQKLLVISPTRTYTVRGGDNLSRIADRFGIKYEKLLANNPYLCGSDKIYPGQVLSIKHDVPLYGMACANGYYYNNCPDERLYMAMPYMTHLTVSGIKREGGKMKTTLDGSRATKIAKSMGIVPLLRVFDTSDPGTLNEAYKEELIETAKKEGYSGITLAAYRAFEENIEGYTEFLRDLKERTAKEKLLLFYEADANKSITLLPDFCDGCVAMYEKCNLASIPSFEDGEATVYEKLAERIDPSKIYLDLSPFGYAGEEAVTKKEAEKAAANSKSEIKYDDEKKICFFDYNKYKGGKKETVRVVYEALENIKSKLELIGELGFMGISFDIMRAPVEHLMMLSSMFTKPGANYFDSSADI